MAAVVGWAVRRRVTPSTMSPTVLRVLRASSGISMWKASSTSKEMLILSRESMLSSSKVLARVTESAGMLLDLAMISIQRAATSVMVVKLPLMHQLTAMGWRCKGGGLAGEVGFRGVGVKQRGVVDVEVQE